MLIVILSPQVEECRKILNNLKGKVGFIEIPPGSQSDSDVSLLCD